MRVTTEIKGTLLYALECYRGDDLERAKWAFKGWSKEQMAKPWSGNGDSAQEVLDGYQEHRDQVERAKEFVEGLKP